MTEENNSSKEEKNTHKSDRFVLDIKKVLRLVDESKDRFSERSLSVVVGKSPNWIHDLRDSYNEGKEKRYTSYETAKNLADLLGVEIDEIQHSSGKYKWTIKMNDKPRIIREVLEQLLSSDCDPDHEFILELLTCFVVTYVSDKALFARMMVEELLKDERNHQVLMDALESLLNDPAKTTVFSELSGKNNDSYLDTGENRETQSLKTLQRMNTLLNSTHLRYPVSIYSDPSFEYVRDYWWIHYFFNNLPSLSDIQESKIKSVSQISNSYEKELIKALERRRRLEEKTDIQIEQRNIVKRIIKEELTKYFESHFYDSKLNDLAKELLWFFTGSDVALRHRDELINNFVNVGNKFCPVRAKKLSHNNQPK